MQDSYGCHNDGNSSAAVYTPEPLYVQDNYTVYLYGSAPFVRQLYAAPAIVEPNALKFVIPHVDEVNAPLNLRVTISVSNTVPMPPVAGLWWDNQSTPVPARVSSE